MASRLSDDDDTLFTTIRNELSTAVVGDILDTLGHRNQFLPPNITPISSYYTKLVGRAMPVLVENVQVDGDSTWPGPAPEKPFGKLMEALDDLRENDVYIATGKPGLYSPVYALWGGLLSTRATFLKAAGAVLDGYVRDAGEIQALDFTVFGRGLYAQDMGVRGQVVDYRCEIEIGGVRIRPGDLVFGDQEGVVIIRMEVEREAVEKALEKARTEGKVAEAIKGGLGAVEAFEKFGVL